MREQERTYRTTRYEVMRAGEAGAVTQTLASVVLEELGAHLILLLRVRAWPCDLQQDSVPGAVFEVTSSRK